MGFTTKFSSPNPDSTTNFAFPGKSPFSASFLICKYGDNNGTTSYHFHLSDIGVHFTIYITICLTGIMDLLWSYLRNSEDELIHMAAKKIGI